MFRAVFMYVVFQIIRIPLFGLKKEKKEVPLLCVVYCQLYNRRAECSYSFCVYGVIAHFCLLLFDFPPLRFSFRIYSIDVWCSSFAPIDLVFEKCSFYSPLLKGRVMDCRRLRRSAPSPFSIFLIAKRTENV